VIRLINASAHNTGLDAQSVHCIVTSPPYWGLRAYAGEQRIEWPAVTYSPMPGLPAITIEPMTLTGWCAWRQMAGSFGCVWWTAQRAIIGKG
jgi:DNA modification methylase